MIRAALSALSRVSLRDVEEVFWWTMFTVFLILVLS